MTSFDTAQAFFRFARDLVRSDAPTSWDRSDDDMNQKARMIPQGLLPKPAAVLIGICDGEAGPSVLLTLRKSTLSNHGGQIAFPGGRIDGDETAVAAALREAEEEIALDPRFVEPEGFLDGYLTVTGYFIVPVLARIAPGYSLHPHEHEVEDIFEVPLSFLLESRNRETHSRDWQGLTRHYYVYPYRDCYIWGATAGIIKNLSDRLQHATA